MSDDDQKPQARFRWRSPWARLARPGPAQAPGVLRFEPVEPRVLLSADLNPLASSALSGSLASYTLPPSAPTPAPQVDLGGNADISAFDAQMPPAVSAAAAATPSDGALATLAFTDLTPLGSLAQAAHVEGNLTAAGSDTYSYDAPAAAPLAFVVAPQGDLAVQLTLRDGDGVLLTQVSGAAGTRVTVNAGLRAGAYTLEVQQLSGAGDYTLDAAVNAAVSFGAADLADAQLIDGPGVALPNGADRLVVTGPLTASGISAYAFDVQAGQSVSLAVGRSSGGVTQSLTVYDDAGNVLARGVPGGGVDALVVGLTGAAAGRLFAVVGGAPGAEHTLLVTRGALFNDESRAGVAQDLFGARTVLGRLGGGGAEGLTRVAVLSNQLGGDLVARLNGVPAHNFEATGVLPGMLTAESLNGYDVVVLGDYTVDNGEVVGGTLDTLAPVLRNWVEQGHGVVATGFITYEAGNSSGTPIVDIDAIVPVNTLGSYASFFSPIIDINATAHPVTAGVADFAFTNGYVEYAPPDAGSLVLATASGSPAVVVGEPGFGRSVYLGPALAAGFANTLGGYDTDGERLLEQALVWAGNARDGADAYQVPAASGDTLSFETTTPDTVEGVASTLDLMLVLHGPDGVEVASAHLNAADGRNAVLSYVVPQDGIYSIEVRAVGLGEGDYTLSIADPVPATSFTASLAFIGAGIPNVARVTLSAPALLTSVQAEDLTVNGIAATSVTVIDPTTLEFDISGAATADGSYTVVLADGVITRLDGQGLVGVTTELVIDTGAPRVDGFSLASDVVTTPGAVAVLLTISEPYDPLSIQSGTIHLTNDATGVETIVGYTSSSDDPRFLGLNFTDLASGSYTLTMDVGAYRDVAGNLSDFFLLSFVFDNDAEALPPFAAQAPLGSLVYASDVEAVAGSTGDVDSYVLPPAAFQPLAVQLVGPAGADLRLELVDAFGAVLASANTGYSTTPLNLSLPPDSGATSVRVTSDDGAGGYTLKVVLGALIGSGASSFATAESIDESSIALTAQADRLAVAGEVTGSGTSAYAFTVSAGQPTSIALGSVSGTPLSLSIYGPDGLLVATGESGGGDTASLVAGLGAAVSGRYVAIVGGPAGARHTLLVVRNAAFNDERSTTAAQDLFGASAALGHLGSNTGAGSTGTGVGTTTTPYTLNDGTGFRWDIQGSGYISDGTSDAYDGGLILAGFSFSNTGGTELSGRQLVLGPQTISGVQVERKIYVPSATGLGYARFLEIVTNTDTVVRNFTVQINTNLGSDSSTVIYATSSGDLNFTPADTWIGTDDFNGGGDPTLIHVIAGDAGRVRPTTATRSGDNLAYSYDLTLAPGQTQIVMHFASQNPNQDTARAKAPLLAALDPTLDALAGLTPFERSAIVNFDAGDSLDSYRVPARAGTTLSFSTTTPDLPDGTPNTLDVLLVLRGPTGAEVARNDNGGADGRNAFLGYVAPADGTYTLEVRSVGAGVGPYVLSVTGAASSEPFTATILSPVAGAQLNSLPTTVRVGLSSPALVSSVQASDLTVDGVAATAVVVIDPLTLQFTVAVTGDGDHTIALAAGAFTRLDGQALGAASSLFNVDTTAPFITASSLPADFAVPPGDLALTLTLSEAVDPSGLDAADLILTNTTTGLAVGGSTLSYDAATLTLSIGFRALIEGNYTLALNAGPGGLRDLRQNPLAAYVLPFRVDFDNQALPDFVALAPFGSLVHRATVAGNSNGTGDVDSFSLALDDDQALTVTLTPTAGLTARLELLDSIGFVVATGTAGGPGSPVQIALPPAAGVRSIRVTSLDGSGSYTLVALLNAQVEAEIATGLNETQGTAESLLPSLHPLVAGADRLAVVGRLTSAADVDDYSFTLAAGQAATIAVDDAGQTGTLSLSLTDDAGVELARGVGSDGVSSSRAIYRFIPTVGGVFHARIAAVGTGFVARDYTLVVTRGADFDIEVADDTALETGGVVLGGLARGVASAGGGVSSTTGTTTLPTVLTDGIGFRWDPQADGNISDGTNDAYDGGLRLNGFPGFTTAGTQLGGRQIVIGPQTVGGLQVSRKIYVPSTVGQGYARFLEIVSNTSATTQTYTVGIATNLGSDGSTFSYATSSGDTAFTTADNWIGTDDSNGFGDPSLVHVIAGVTGRVRPAAVGLSGDNLSYSYNLTLAPGQTQIVLHFASQNVNQAAALVTAGKLTALDASIDPLAGLSGAERSQIVNFDAGDAVDRYVVAASAGDTLNVSLTRPGAGPDSPANTLAPRLELYDPAGLLVVGADGFALSYPVPSESGGRYEVRVLRANANALDSGEYVLRVQGATGATANTAPSVRSSSVPADGGSVAALPAAITLVFSEGLRLDTLSASDLVLTNGVTATAVEVIDGRTVRFTLAGDNNEGVYGYSLAAGAVSDLRGTPSLAYAASFKVDRTGPVVASQSPNIQAAAPFSSFSVTFDEAIDPASVSIADVTRFVGPDGSDLRFRLFSAVVVGRTVTFNFNAQNVQGVYGFTIGPNIVDVVGNAMAAPYVTELALTSPDLTVSGVTGPASLTFGAAADFSWTVTNTGTDPALGRWYDRVYLSLTPTVDGNSLYLGDVSGNLASLGVGESYTRTARLIPPLRAGAVNANYYVIVLADIFSQQAESSETNNTARSGLIPVSVPALPDLQVSSVVIPAEALSGQVVPITWTLRNAGTADTGPFTDGIYLSDDAAGTVGLQFFGYFTLDDGIRAGESVTRTQAITLPAVFSGSKYVQIRTDALGQVFENFNETNNTLVSSSPMLVRLQTFPNLVVDVVTPPVRAFSGQSTTVSWNVTNTGNGPTSAPQWSDRVYLSLDRTLDAADLVLATLTNPSYLDVGQSYASTATITLPQGISGTYYLLVVTDLYNQVNEYPNDGDNLTVSAAVPVTLTPPPNLVVPTVSAPANAFSGQPLAISWRVNNTGTGATPNESWSDRVVLSADATLDATDTVLNGGVVHYGRLGATEGYTASATVNLPVGVEGDYYLFVVADTRNEVFESVFEADNSGRTSAPTHITLTPPPDLETAIVTAPIAGVSGHAVSLTYSVTNVGADRTPNDYWVDQIYLSQTPTITASSVLVDQVARYGSLDIDATYSVTRNVLLPENQFGTRYLVVRADGGNVVFQLDRANDIAATAAVDVVQRQSDLVVSATTAPANGQNGGQLLVNWTVANRGVGDTITGQWYDNVYATLSGSRDNAILLGQFQHTGVIGVGGSYDRSELVDLPFNLAAGSYTIYVRTDAYSYVNESNELNNADGPGVVVNIISRLADLVVGSLVTGSSVTTGSTIDIAYTVTNAGANRTQFPYWYDNVYASLDGSLDGGDRLIASIRRDNPLAAGASYDVATSIAIPVQLPAGTYRLFVSTDFYNFVLEGSETNNVAMSGPVVVTAYTGPPLGDGSVGTDAFPNLATTLVDAPDTAISGQPIHISWNVTNSGDAARRYWYDAVYLSRDQVLDRTQDISLGAIYQSAVAAGGSYTASLDGLVPAGLSGPFWVFVVADAGGYLNDPARGNNARIDPGAVAVSLAPPVDLVAGSIVVPAEALLGTTVSIDYTVNNNSGNAAVGSWVDSLYLSTDDVWTVADPLIGRVTHSGGVAANGAYTERLTTTLPGVALGTYKVIVRSDILNYVPESNEANNLSASIDRVQVNVTPLVLGTPAIGTLGAGGSAYYRVDVAAGETLRLALDSAAADAGNEIYVRYGAVPDSGTYDALGAVAYEPDQALVVPTTQAGTYYVLVHGTFGASASFGLLAEIIPFSIRAVHATVVGNAGPSTLKVEGAKFAAGTRFELVDAADTVVSASRVVLADTATAYVTFALNAVATGAYTLRAINGPDVVTLVHAIDVVAQTDAADVDVGVIGAVQFRPSRLDSFSVQYGNTGLSDVEAPLLVLTTASGIALGTSIDDLGVHPIQLLGASLDGSPDVLRAGEAYAASVLIQTGATTGPLDIRIGRILANDQRAIDWTNVAAAIRPTGIANDVWDRFYARFQAGVGTTWGDYVHTINRMMLTLSPAGQPIRDVRALFARQIALDVDWRPASAATGRLQQSDTDAPVAGLLVSAYRQDADGRFVLGGTAVSGADGSFAFTRLAAGTYQLGLEGRSLDVDRDQLGDTSGYSFTVASSGDTALGTINVLTDVRTYNVQEAEPATALDGDGRAHIIWTRDGIIFHARFDGTTWVDAAPIAAIANATNLRLVYSPKLLGGALPGLIAVWTAGDGNQSEVYAAVTPLGPDGAVAWANPIKVTDDAISDVFAEVAVAADGKVTISYVKRNADIQDDGDVYYSVLSITLPVETAAVEAAAAEAAPIDGALVPEGGASSVAVNIYRKFGPWSGAGLEFGIEIKFEGKGEVKGCSFSASASGGVKGGVKAPSINADLSGSGSISGSWSVDQGTKDWKFDSAKANFKAEGSFDWKGGLFFVLGKLGPQGAAAVEIIKDIEWLIQWFDPKAKIEDAINVKVGIEYKGLSWSLNAPFPEFVLPESYDKCNISIAIGPTLKLKAPALGDVEFKASGFIKVAFDIEPSFKLTEVSGNLSIEGKVNGWGFSRSIGLGYYADVGVSGSTTYDGVTVEASDLTLLFDPANALGTGLTYGGQHVIADLSTDLYNDGPMTIAYSAAGTEYGAWTKTVDAIGSQIVVAENATGTWSAPQVIAGSYGFNSAAKVIVDAAGRRIVMWAHADATGLGAGTTIEELLAARKATDLYYVIDDGTGFGAVTLLAHTDGTEDALTLGIGADGRVVASWAEQTARGVMSLHAASLSGNVWSTAATIANGVSISAATITVTGGATTLFWSQDDGADSTPARHLEFSRLVGGVWTGPAQFAPVFAPGVLSVQSSGGVALPSDTPVMTNALFPPVPVPEECLKCKPEDIKKITEAAPDCRDGGGSTKSFDPERCIEKTVIYAPCVVRPRDPNDIIGPDGFGDEGFIAADGNLTYKIRFENAPDARAPAQRVVVTEQLDADLDYRTFRPTGFGFDNQRFDLAGTRAFYSARIDLTATKGYSVDVSISIDVRTGIATWILSTVDPETGEAPADAGVGLLPVNDLTGRGEGYLTYTVHTRRTAATGDVVTAQARIVFDTEEPIDTPVISNTLDVVAPTSHIDPLAATSDSAEFDVSWTGTDDVGGSAVGLYTVSVSVDGGERTAWLARTDRTSGHYVGALGHTYAFFVTAQDNALNDEAEHATADATIAVGAGVTGSLSGTVFIDTNASGVRDGGEAGGSGFVVLLDANANGALDDGELTQTTGIDGSYSFTALAPASYSVLVLARDGYVATTATAATVDVVAGADTAIPTVGEFALGSLSGIVFSDADGNGAQGAGEAGLSGRTVYLDLDNDAVLDAGEITVTTTSSGGFSFTGVGPGVQHVRTVVPAHWRATSAVLIDVTVTSGLASTGLTFATQQLGSIAGIKFEDVNANSRRDAGEAGLADWTIFLDADGDGQLDAGERSTVTAIGGAYSFEDVAPGDYVVSEVLKPGWRQTYPGPVVGTATTLTTSASAAALLSPGR